MKNGEMNRSGNECSNVCHMGESNFINDGIVKRKAYAKVNLALDVVRRREDGYHEVRMIMQTVEIFDVLTFTAQEEPGIIVRTDKEELSLWRRVWQEGVRMRRQFFMG